VRQVTAEADVPCKRKSRSRRRKAAADACEDASNEEEEGCRSRRRRRRRVEENTTASSSSAAGKGGGPTAILLLLFGLFLQIRFNLQNSHSPSTARIVSERMGCVPYYSISLLAIGFAGGSCSWWVCGESAGQSSHRRLHAKRNSAEQRSQAKIAPRSHCADARMTQNSCLLVGE